MTDYNGGCEHQYSRFIRRGKHGGLSGEWRWCYDCGQRYFDPYIEQPTDRPQRESDAWRLQPFIDFLKGKG